ncbi:MAG: ABC transporter ATP-binding protein [Candidatus Komeilibacteria bacterium]
MVFFNTQKVTVSNNPLPYLFGRMWHYSQNRKTVVLFWTMFLAVGIMELIIPPFIWAKIMDIVLRQGVMAGSFKLLVGFLGLMLLEPFLTWSLHGPARVMEENNAFLCRANYRKYLLRGVMTLPMEWHTEHHSGDVFDKIEKGTGALYAFSQYSFEIIYALVRLFGSYLVLIYFSRPAALIVLTMILVSAWITIRFDRILIHQYKELNRAENQISANVFDAISNISTVIILRVERLVYRAIVGKIDQPYDLQRLNNQYNEWKWFLTNICCTTMTVVVLLVYLWQHLGSKPGELVVPLGLLYAYLRNINDVFFRFTSMYGDIIIRRAKIMNAEELSRDFIAESFANHVLPPDWRTLQITGLTFFYQQNNDQEPSLNDISLELNRGERIAFVGRSGSGKTTLLKLMRDLYHPQQLDLLVDGRQVPEGFAGISRAIALVPQDPEIFATTIGENITLGAEHDPETVRRFTDMACFSAVVNTLPHGLQSSIKEKGVNLSGGQQQRLALSRGLLACDDKDVLLLDEPTSSQDTETEMAIYRNIFGYFRQQAIISSVHRLHILPLFDRIYFFQEGKILASGSLNELLLTCPEFSQQWEQYHHPERISE